MKRLVLTGMLLLLSGLGLGASDRLVLPPPYRTHELIIETHLPPPDEVIVEHHPTQLPPPRATHTTPSVLVDPMIGLPYNYLPPYEPVGPETPLPLPTATLHPPKLLTLRDAIMLALRSNESVLSSELQRIVDKYQVILAREVFQPQYTFKLNSTLTRGLKPAWNFTPTLSVLTPIGTQINIDYQNNFLRGSPGAATVTVMQPFLKGFGKVNTVGYYDALTSEEVAKLGFKNNIIAVVVAVIQSYRTLVQDYKNLDIQKRTLKESANALKQYELQVKVGKMAPSDLLQQKSTYATTKLALVQQEDSLHQNYQTFLNNLGLVPTAKLRIVKKIDKKSYPVPSQDDAIRRAMAGNIQYRTDLLNLENTRRAIITAKDSRKWTFDVTASTVIGTTQDPNLITGPEGSGPVLGFDFEIPIDNVQGKADLVSARVALEQAKLALENEKENLIRQVITQLETIHNQEEQIKVSETQVKMSALALKAARIKLKYGRSTVFEVTTDQDQLLTQETALVGTRITYMNSVTSFYALLGETLDKWNIKLKY